MIFSTWSVFVSTCYLYEYHFIREDKTWEEAQKYCRENYADLASVFDMADHGETAWIGQEFKILNKSESSLMNVWIGLFRDTWRWSDGSNFSFRHWDMESFNDGQNKKKCAVTLLNRSRKWSSDECNKKNYFFCYGDKLILINENKTWEEALDYCRLHHTDLVSITNPHQQRWVERRAKNASSPTYGDKAVCYENWADNGKIEECG
ncbi:C-type lectin lectoxin-Phi2-like [Astatotilapia calliptera]|uniref:C-type lectin lectoxin-Phi2-like n=1 Tax=Astatotilapia calliptera TaxID=8154 RepID=UPI000E4111ED|nr:C-type lectin lectoxin-Phi2-like [Astatotilapia calliptera]